MALTERSGRLIILDPSLTSAHGQRYTITSCIAERAIQNGYEVVVFANRSVGSNLEVVGAKVRPVFGMTTYDYFKSIEKGGKLSLSQSFKDVVRTYFPAQSVRLLKRLRNKLEIILSRAGAPISLIPDLGRSGIDDELRGAMLKDSVVSRDHIIVHTSDAVMYRTILNLLLKLYPLGAFPCIHMCTPYEERDMPFQSKGMSVDRVINYLEFMGFLKRYIFLYAEGEKLAQSLSRDWGVEVTGLGILQGQMDDNLLSESYIESHCIAFADKLLAEVGEVAKKSVLEEGGLSTLSSVKGGQNADNGMRESVHLNNGDVLAKSGYNDELCEAVVSNDGHPLFVKQIRS
jgi:hypothetical protein